MAKGKCVLSVQKLLDEVTSTTWAEGLKIQMLHTITFITCIICKALFSYDPMNTVNVTVRSHGLYRPIGLVQKY